MDATSAPFIRGIAKSNTIKSGLNCFACSMACMSHVGGSDKHVII
jgi:aldehyde:ferredoxin oxidoreductase